MGLVNLVRWIKTRSGLGFMVRFHHLRFICRSCCLCDSRNSSASPWVPGLFSGLRLGWKAWDLGKGSGDFFMYLSQSSSINKLINSNLLQFGLSGSKCSSGSSGLSSKILQEFYTCSEHVWEESLWKPSLDIVHQCRNKSII